jgi:capsular polysaccharide export protein
MRALQSVKSRRVLLLQGPPTGFFTALGRAFEASGIPTRRVLLNAGDALRGNGIPFRGRLGEFGGFLDRLIADEGITDVLYFADRLPYHRIAERVATGRGAMPYVVEHGYLRPDWITLEPGGMGAYSRFPADRRRILEIAEGAPPVDDAIRYRHSFATEAFHDVSHVLTRLAFTPGFPHYERDRPNHPLAEYASWLPQLVRRQVARARAERQLARVIAENSPFFLFAMQLQEDYQIRHNSRYQNLADLIEEVFSSFAAFAPKDASLLVKLHPLDNGLANWPRVLKAAKRRHGLTGRIRFMGAGPLIEMLRATAGVVLVNSTVGVTALRNDVPVKALGAAIYDLEGLTDQAPLDRFWRHPTRPDPTFVDAFVRALARATQLKGSFYDKEGIAVACAEIVRRVAAGLGDCGWFVTPPPRLTRALRAGVPREPAVVHAHGRAERIDQWSELW